MPQSTWYAVTERSVGLFTLHTTSFRRGNNSQRKAAPLAALAGSLHRGVLVPYRGGVLVRVRLDRLAQRQRVRFQS